LLQNLTSGYEQKASRCAGQVVTIFALHQDSFIVTQNLSSVYQFRKTGSGQFLQPRQLYLSPGLAKIAPWWLARQDYFLAKAPRLVSAGCATNAFCSYPLAVRHHITMI
jgi:hypothetical protein